MTYFSLNKDTDNSGGLLAAVVASSLSSGLRSQISSVATSDSPTDHIQQPETGKLKERLKTFSIRSNLFFVYDLLITIVSEGSNLKVVPQKSHLSEGLKSGYQNMLLCTKDEMALERSVGVTHRTKQRSEYVSGQ